MFGLGKKQPPQIIGVNCVEKCPKDNRCPQWVVLTSHYKKDDGGMTSKEEGRCAIAWIPTLLIEIKSAITLVNIKDK